MHSFADFSSIIHFSSIQVNLISAQTHATHCVAGLRLVRILSCAFADQPRLTYRISSLAACKSDMSRRRGCSASASA